MKQLGAMTAVATAMVLVLAGSPMPPAVAAPEPELCDYEPARGAVPGDFPIDACVDGRSVVLRNDLHHPVVAEARGSVEDPRRARMASGPRSSVVRLVVDADVVLLPGDVVRWPLGDGPAQVAVATAEPATAPAIVRSLQRLLPRVGSAEVRSRAYTAVAELVVDLARVIDDRTACLEGRNFLQATACDVTAAWSTSTAVIAQEGIDVGPDLLSIVLDPDRWTQWAQSRPAALGGPDGAGTVLTQRAAPGWSGVLPPWADRSMLPIDFRFGIPIDLVVSGPVRAALASLGLAGPCPSWSSIRSPVWPGWTPGTPAASGSPIIAPGSPAPERTQPGRVRPSGPPAGDGPSRSEKPTGPAPLPPDGDPGPAPAAGPAPKTPKPAPNPPKPAPEKDEPEPETDKKAPKPAPENKQPKPEADRKAPAPKTDKKASTPKGGQEAPKPKADKETDPKAPKPSDDKKADKKPDPKAPKPSDDKETDPKAPKPSDDKKADKKPDPKAPKPSDDKKADKQPAKPQPAKGGRGK